MSAFTISLHLSKADQGTQRYDLEINNNADIIDAAIRMFPGADPPGADTNFPDVVPSNGLKWLCTSDHTLRIYYAGVWQIIATLIP